MPNQDRTGPNGQGPRTGKGLGKCNNSSVEESSKKGQGFGRGRGLGKGQGQGKGLQHRNNQ